MARDVKLEIRQICEECRNAIFEEIFSDTRYFGEVPTALEQLAIYQDYREKAVEQLPFKYWEWVHAEFDRIYAELEEDAEENANAYC